MWHAAILNTKFYEELQSSLGATLHHNPAGAEDADRKNRQTRLENMKATYCHFFDKEPEELTEREPAYATRYATSSFSIASLYQQAKRSACARSIPG